MKIQIQETYQGTPVEILEQLRMEERQDIPTVEAYISLIHDAIQRLTGVTSSLEGNTTAEQAEYLIHYLAALGALEILEDAGGE